MATSVGLMAAQVADRVRDPFFNGTTQAQVINLLSYSQQVINGTLDDVTAQSNLVHQPRTMLYQVSAFVPQAVKILAIMDAYNRDLEPNPFSALSWFHQKWLTSVADTPRTYHLAGRDLLVIYPGVRSPQTLTVVYTTLTAPLTVTSDVTVVPNEDDDAIYDLTEILLLLKNRDLIRVNSIIERFKERIQRLQEGHAKIQARITTTPGDNR